MRLEDVILRDTRANQPAATVVAPGTIYCVTDEDNIQERSDGTNWQTFSTTAAGTGDVTGAAASTNSELPLFNGITGKSLKRSNTLSGLVKLASGVVSAIQASGGSILLGRRSGSSGDFEEITLGSGLQISSQELSVTNPAWTDIFKTANQTISDNTVVADNTLVFNLEANSKYVIMGSVFFVGTAADDFRYQFTGPAAATRTTIKRSHLPPNSTTVTNAIDEAYSTLTNIACAAGDDGWLTFECSIDNGVNAGNFSFEWAKQTNASGANSAVVYSGSWLRYRKVA